MDEKRAERRGREENGERKGREICVWSALKYVYFILINYVCI